MLRTFLVLILLLCAPLSCSEIECGSGTHEEEGKCVPNIPLKCGDGTRLERGWCIVADVVTPKPDTADNRDGQDD